MLQRIGQALRMDGEVYKRAANDTSLNGEALFMVLIVLVAGVLGDLAQQGEWTEARILETVASHLGRWALWPVGCGLISLVAHMFFGGSGSVGGLMRALAYSYLPQVLTKFVFIPTVGWLLGGIGVLWSLLTMVVAVREAMNLSPRGAVGTVVLIIGVPSALYLVAAVMAARV